MSSFLDLDITSKLISVEYDVRNTNLININNYIKKNIKKINSVSQEESNREIINSYYDRIKNSSSSIFYKITNFIMNLSIKIIKFIKYIVDTISSFLSSGYIVGFLKRYNKYKEEIGVPYDKNIIYKDFIDDPEETLVPSVIEFEKDEVRNMLLLRVLNCISYMEVLKSITESVENTLKNINVVSDEIKNFVKEEIVPFLKESDFENTNYDKLISKIDSFVEKVRNLDYYDIYNKFILNLFTKNVGSLFTNSSFEEELGNVAFNDKNFSDKYKKIIEDVRKNNSELSDYIENTYKSFRLDKDKIKRSSYKEYFSNIFNSNKKVETVFFEIIANIQSNRKLETYDKSADIIVDYVHNMFVNKSCIINEDTISSIKIENPKNIEYDGSDKLPKKHTNFFYIDEEGIEKFVELVTKNKNVTSFINNSYRFYNKIDSLNNKFFNSIDEFRKSFFDSYTEIYTSFVDKMDKYDPESYEYKRLEEILVNKLESVVSEVNRLFSVCVTIYSIYNRINLFISKLTSKIISFYMYNIVSVDRYMTYVYKCKKK